MRAPIVRTTRSGSRSNCADVKRTNLYPAPEYLCPWPTPQIVGARG